MAVRTIIGCDSCGAEPAEHLEPLNLGDGPMGIDLCPDCQASFGVDKLRMLLDEYGQPVGLTSVPTRPMRLARPTAVRSTEPERTDWPCPYCDVEPRGERRSVLKHLQAEHGMDLVSASKLVPPRGKAVACSVCGFLVAEGAGVRMHMTSAHPDAQPELFVAGKA